VRLDQKTLTLLGSTALFIAVSLALLRAPGWAPATFPLYGLIFLWSDLRRESEPPIIYVFLVSAAGLLLLSRAAGADKAALGAGLVSLWALSGALALHVSDEQRCERQAVVERLALDARVRDDERELKYYRSYEQSAEGQIRLRRELSESARSLSQTLDAREVHQRLISILAARYPGSRVVVTAGAGEPLSEWAARKKGPLLVRDAASDERFRGASVGCRSALVVPLKVMHQQAGFVSLAADGPDAYGPEDVKSVDMLATLAALSLENIQFYEQVHQQANHDPLTQLYSHKAFQNRLQEEVLRSGRSQTPLSMILCDIDHFKRYNDEYGHQAGDHLLRTVAAIIASFARPVDMAARYGGEEFALILPNFVRSEAVQLADRLRQRIASEPFVFQGKNTTATMSLGVASFPTDATTASQIVRVADERLYRAKDGGRNQVVG
jgi:diguanylate cyclase (GGDEF)-like protein